MTVLFPSLFLFVAVICGKTMTADDQGAVICGKIMTADDQGAVICGTGLKGQDRAGA